MRGHPIAGRRWHLQPKRPCELGDTMKRGLGLHKAGAKHSHIIHKGKDLWVHAGLQSCRTLEVSSDVVEPSKSPRMLQDFLQTNHLLGPCQPTQSSFATPARRSKHGSP